MVFGIVPAVLNLSKKSFSSDTHELMVPSFKEVNQVRSLSDKVVGEIFTQYYLIVGYQTHDRFVSTDVFEGPRLAVEDELWHLKRGIWHDPMDPLCEGSDLDRPIFLGVCALDTTRASFVGLSRDDSIPWKV